MSRKAIPRTLTVPNPDWLASEDYRDALATTGYPLEDFLPEEHGKALPPEGGWILMMMSVRVGVPVAGQDVAENVKRRKVEEPEREEISVKTITIPHLSVWFAVPTLTSNREMHQAIVRAPDGVVHVWPHEYKPIDIEKFLEFGPEDGFHTNFLSESGAFDEAALFYIRSRGVSLADAQRMLLGNLKDPNYCYFTFDDAFRDFFSEGTGTPYLMPHNHARRATAHKRRTA